MSRCSGLDTGQHKASKEVFLENEEENDREKNGESRGGGEPARSMNHGEMMSSLPRLSV